MTLSLPWRPLTSVSAVHRPRLEGGTAQRARSSSGRRGRFAFGVLLATLVLMVGCTAPGMKLNVESGKTPDTSRMGDLDVTLRRLDPTLVKAQNQPPPMDQQALADLTEVQPKPYLIGPQDILLVTVWDHPEITLALGQYRTDNATGSLVDEQGKIYFPYIGQVQVGGLTISQARTKITTELAKVLQKPQVDLKMLAFRSQKVFIGGQVKTPAAYNVDDVPFTLTQAINRAGGFTPEADDSRIILTRGDKSWTLNFQALLAQGNLAGRIYLKDGDSLHIPSNVENPIYMMGELTTPGTLPLVHGHITLAKAISDAGGLLSTSADARSIYVIRKGDSASGVDVFHLDGRNPTSMVLADQFALRPRDIVYVDAGTLVRFSRVMSLILPTVSAVASTASAGTQYYIVKRNY